MSVQSGELDSGEWYGLVFGSIIALIGVISYLETNDGDTSMGLVEVSELLQDRL